MHFTEAILLGFALAMDCFAVSITSGSIVKRYHSRSMTLMILLFGIFQGGMTGLGWFVSTHFSKYLESIDHWIAFSLLAIIGIQMLREGFTNNTEKEPKFNPLDLKVVFTLAVATSIDAMAVGVSMAFMGLHHWNDISLPSLIIALISSAMTAIGLMIGIFIGRKLPCSPTPIGGLILIGIGIKIIIEHTYLS